MSLYLKSGLAGRMSKINSRMSILENALGLLLVLSFISLLPLSLMQTDISIKQCQKKDKLDVIIHTKLKNINTAVCTITSNWMFQAVLLCAKIHTVYKQQLKHLMGSIWRHSYWLVPRAGPTMQLGKDIKLLFSKYSTRKGNWFERKTGLKVQFRQKKEEESFDQQV